MLLDVAHSFVHIQNTRSRTHLGIPHISIAYDSQDFSSFGHDPYLRTISFYLMSIHIVLEVEKI